MNVRTFLYAATAAFTFAALAGCDDGSSTNSGGSGGTTSSGGTTTQGGGGAGGSTGGAGGTGGGAQAMPKLGTQIDRMGRPAINTATNQTFNSNPEQADQGKDAWNTTSDPTKWGDFVPEIEKNLAILDGLDTVCGNQLLADDMKGDPSRYATLATVLSDDRLYVNMAGGTCTMYLGVEANAVGVMNEDCGGRTLAYDVIDASYTALATGALDGSVGDDVAISDAAKGETFPFLADPN